MVRFKEKDMFQFIDLYKSHECLWRGDHTDFKIQSKRSEALSNIRNALNLSSNLEVLIIEKSFRYAYASESMKMKVSKELATHPGEVYKSKVRWYNLADSFLKNLPTDENMVVDKLPDPIRTVNPNGPLQQNRFDKTNHPDQFIDVSTETTNFPCVNPSQAKMRDEPLSEGTHQTDEFYYFGMNLAMQLRTLPLEEALNLQTKFQQMLYEQRVQCGQSRFDTNAARSSSSVKIVEANSETNEEDIKPEMIVCHGD